jgi:hypothetical protein
MTLNFGLLLFALSIEQQMSTAIPNVLRALRTDMVKVLLKLTGKK